MLEEDLLGPRDEQGHEGTEGNAMSSKVMRNRFDIGVNYFVFYIVDIVVYGRVNTE